MYRRPPDEDQDHRNHQHDHYDRRRNHRPGETEITDRRHHQGYAGDAAETRAVQGQADRHAALAVEPQAERVGDHAEAGAGPAKGEQGIGKVELPGLAHLTDRDRGHGHRAYACYHAVPGTKCADRLADEDDQRRAGQIEERRAGRDQRGRPTVQPMQLGDIDALAVEAEPPAKSRQQEADDDDTPAVVADRGFIDGGVIGGVQRCLLLSVLATSSCPGEVVCLAQTAYTCLRSRASRREIADPLANCFGADRIVSRCHQAAGFDGS
jgi:hypothetical protein